MKKNKVFLVDDHCGLRDALAELINGFDQFKAVAVASNGKEAIEKLEQGLEPDIILLDLSMPVMNGYEVADWLAENRPQVKILVMTMGVEKNKLLQLIAAGVTGILNKDATKPELNEALEAVLAGRSYFSNAVTRDIAAVYRREENTNATVQKYDLTAQDLEFIKLCATEMTYKEIGHQMGLSKNASELLRVNLFNALGIKNRVGLAMFAVRKGFVDF